MTYQFPHSEYPKVDLIARAAASIRSRAEAAAAEQGCSWWSAPAALAVADWLDIGANPYACVQLDPMIAVARAYLGAADQ